VDAPLACGGLEETGHGVVQQPPRGSSLRDAKAASRTAREVLPEREAAMVGAARLRP